MQKNLKGLLARYSKLQQRLEDIGLKLDEISTNKIASACTISMFYHQITGGIEGLPITADDYFDAIAALTTEPDNAKKLLEEYEDVAISLEGVIRKLQKLGNFYPAVDGDILVLNNPK